MPRRSLDDPWIKKVLKMIFHNKIKQKHRFVIHEYLEDEFDYKTYLEFKSSTGAFDCLNITFTARLGCTFMAKQSP